MDQKLFALINNLAGRNQSLDKLMIFASTKARYIFVFPIVFLLLCHSAKKRFFMHTLLSTLANLGINSLVNQFNYRPRPFMIRHANVLLPSKQNSTIMSKHTVLSFGISTTIYMYNKCYGLIMSLLSLLTGVSRVWTGAHYPFDVIRSAFIGSVVSVWIKWFLKKVRV